METKANHHVYAAISGPISRTFQRKSQMSHPVRDPKDPSEIFPKHFVCLRGNGMEARGDPEPPPPLVLIPHRSFSYKTRRVTLRLHDLI